MSTKKLLVVLMFLSSPAFAFGHFHWHHFRQGPPGPQGPAGPAGADGTNGAPGSDGQAGPAGTNGQVGADGAAGSAGASGAPGTAGTNGSDANTDNSLFWGVGTDVRWYDAKYWGLHTTYTHDFNHGQNAVFGIIAVKIGKSYEEKEMEQLKYLLANTQEAMANMRKDMDAPRDHEGNKIIWQEPPPGHSGASGFVVVPPARQEPVHAVIHGASN